VLRHRPNEFDALHLLGLLNYQRDRLPEALRLIGAALECNGRSVDAWSNLGMVFHAKGELEKALWSYEEALARFEQSLALLERGDLSRGFAANEARWRPTNFCRSAAASPRPCGLDTRT
jgi:tetratricopeptide (TPR) repeat protein